MMECGIGCRQVASDGKVAFTAAPGLYREIGLSERVSGAALSIVEPDVSKRLVAGWPVPDIHGASSDTTN